MPQFQPSPEEIVEIIEDALAEWKLSHEQLARLLDCSKESVENWLRKKSSPRPHALRAIEMLRDHLQNGEPLPPKIDVRARARHDTATGSIISLSAPSSAFAVEAAAAVQRFFQSLAAKQFEAAWKCLTSGFQERRWTNGYEEFRVGYEGFVGIDNLIVAPLNPVAPPYCRVFAYYEDVTQVIELPGFGKWNTAQFGQLEECCEILLRLKKAILTNGATRRTVEHVLLSSLFTEQAGNILHAASHMPRETFLAAIGSDAVQQCLLSAPLIAKVLRVNKGRFQIDQLIPVQWGKCAPVRN